MSRVWLLIRKVGTSSVPPPDSADARRRRLGITQTFPSVCSGRHVSYGGNTGSGTRRVVVEEAALHRKELVQKRLFQDLIRELGDFAVDLVLKIA